MPIKNDRIYCINHPDVELIPANEEESWRHFVLLAVQRADERYDILQKGTVMIIHSCHICGYSESYIVKEEIDNIKKKVKT